MADREQLALSLPAPARPQRQLVLPAVEPDRHRPPLLRWELPPYKGRGRRPSILRLVVVGDEKRRPVRGVRPRRAAGQHYQPRTLDLVEREDGAVFWVARAAVAVPAPTKERP